MEIHKHTHNAHKKQTHKRKARTQRVLAKAGYDKLFSVYRYQLFVIGQPSVNGFRLSSKFR